MHNRDTDYNITHDSGFPPTPTFGQFEQYAHITVTLTVDATTDNNGCLEVVPGSHKNGYERNMLPREENGSISRDWCKEKNWVPVYCKPLSSIGSLLLFGALLAHCSGGNNTEKSRKCVFLTYNAAAEGDFRDRYYERKRKKFPPSYEREEGKDYSKGAKIHNFASPIRG